MPLRPPAGNRPDVVAGCEARSGSRRAPRRWPWVAFSFAGLLACGQEAPPAADSAEGFAVPSVAGLEALGYVDAVVGDPDEQATGVLRHDPARVWPGINVFCSVRSDTVHLLDMTGTPLVRVPIPAAFDPEAAHAARIEQLPAEGPLREMARNMAGRLGADCMAEPDGSGGLLILSSPYLASVGLDGDVRWVERGMHHHDFTRTPEEEILSLTERMGERRFGDDSIPVREHAIAVLDREGRVRRSVPIAKLLGPEIAREVDAWAEQALQEARAARQPVMPLDAYHPNTLEWIDRDTSVARRGQLLLCLRNLDRIAIVDLERDRPIWIWGERELDWPHHPSMLPNGNVIVFDNGFERGYSRLLEVDPRTDEIVWRWQGTPQEPFFSNVRGAAQPLPNGNLLVTESTRGRAFELTRGGEIVWEYVSPDTLASGERKQIYRMFRAAPDAWPELPRRPSVPRKPTSWPGARPRSPIIAWIEGLHRGDADFAAGNMPPASPFRAH